MKKLMGFFVLGWLVLSIQACGLNQGAAGNVLYVSLDDEGLPSNVLIVADTSGKELRRIEVATPVMFLYPLPASQRALARDGESNWYLIFADSGKAERLDIPAEEADSLSPYHYGFSASTSKQWHILGAPQGAPVFLLDMQSGDLAELTSDEVQMTFGGSFSPDGRYLAFMGAALWLAPTSDPQAARQLGEANAYSAVFSQDSQQIAYIQRRDKSFELVIENIESAEAEIVMQSDQLWGRIAFAPDDKHLLLLQADKLSLVTIENGDEEVLMKFPPDGVPLVLLVHTSNPQKALAGMDFNEQRWFFIDLKAKTVEQLDKLNGMMPRSLGSWLNWAMFSSAGGFGNPAQYAFLDLEKGTVTELSGDVEEAGYMAVNFNTDGRRAVIYGRVEDKFRLWLADAESGNVTSLGEGYSGGISSNGQWVVFARQAEETRQIILIPTSGEGEEIPLGAGHSPIWVVP